MNRDLRLTSEDIDNLLAGSIISNEYFTFYDGNLIGLDVTIALEGGLLTRILSRPSHTPRIGLVATLERMDELQREIDQPWDEDQGWQIEELESTVTYLEDDLRERDHEIEDLKEELKEWKSKGMMFDV